MIPCSFPDQDMNNRLNWKAASHLNQLLFTLCCFTTGGRLGDFSLHKVDFIWPHVWMLWGCSSCVYLLSLDTQGTLVGVGVAIAAAHRSEVQGARHDLLHFRTGRLRGHKASSPVITWEDSSYTTWIWITHFFPSLIMIKTPSSMHARTHAHTHTHTHTHTHARTHTYRRMHTHTACLEGKEKEFVYSVEKYQLKIPRSLKLSGSSWISEIGIFHYVT